MLSRQPIASVRRPLRTLIGLGTMKQAVAASRAVLDAMSSAVHALTTFLAPRFRRWLVSDAWIA